MIFPRPAGRINERFPRMQIQLRYAVMAAIKVVRVIPDTYVEESSFCSLSLSFSLQKESHLRCYENNWNPIASNRRPIMQKYELFRKIFSSRLHLVCIQFASLELSSKCHLGNFSNRSNGYSGFIALNICNNLTVWDDNVSWKLPSESKVTIFFLF